jgi:cytochrome c oxidase subunit 2
VDTCKHIFQAERFAIRSSGRKAFFRALALIIPCSLGLSAPVVAADPPMSYLSGNGPVAVVPLTWGLLGISIAVVVIISVLVLVGTLKQRSTADMHPGERLPVEYAGHGLRWIFIGVGISSVVLFAALIWTLEVLADINTPPTTPAISLRVTGYQWWWKVEYLNNTDPYRTLITANEIHIPSGVPVKVELLGGDVIHSFWVPKLAGKTDTIPGQSNVMWLEAKKPGRYRGQCTEYCGHQHAHMALYVIAEPRKQFDAWYDAQLKPAPTPSSPKTNDGERILVYRCGVCHMVRGTTAGGAIAPDLTHLMSRKTIAAGTLPNTIAGLSGWIANPQAVKPGNHMPVLFLSGPELEDLRSYLVTLK